MIRPRKTSDGLRHRQQVRVMGEDNRYITRARQHCLDRAHGESYVNPLLDRGFRRSVPVAQRTQLRDDQFGAFRFPGRYLPAIGGIPEWIAMLRRNATMTLNPNELPCCASTIGSSEEKPETVGAEVPSLDWHTLQAERSARRHIDVLPVNEDRNSGGLRGNQNRGPASAAREPDGGEE